MMKPAITIGLSSLAIIASDPVSGGTPGGCDLLPGRAA